MTDKGISMNKILEYIDTRIDELKSCNLKYKTNLMDGTIEELRQFKVRIKQDLFRW